MPETGARSLPCSFTIANVPPPTVHELRDQLRERGYLSHGIERWFALDPWSSRAFWLELVTVAAKAALVIALFGALPMVAIMLFRNHPLSALETLTLTVIYGTAWGLTSFFYVILIALLLKLRPEIAIDTPRALLAISLAAAGGLTALSLWWWSRFDSSPPIPELLSGLALLVLFFLVATIVVSAALLSFSIYELQRIPAIHQKPRGTVMTTAAMVLLALLFLSAHGVQEKPADAQPLQVLTEPATRRVVLLAVDGLTFALFSSRPPLTSFFVRDAPAGELPGDSTAERWATIGTGVLTRTHGVRAVEGVRLAGGAQLLQTLSTADFVLRDAASATVLATRQPLPPTVRRRDYLWEIFARRGLTALAINWWASEDARAGALTSISQSTVFAAAARARKSGQDAATMALLVDDMTERLLLEHLDGQRPQFATAFLPALDVVLNRLPLDASSRVASSLRALDALQNLLSSLHARGCDVVLVGLPGDRQAGPGVIATTFPTSNRQISPLDVAPTIAALEGFPPSQEMPGRVLAGRELPRIASYGGRSSGLGGGKIDEEYYRNLKSLGYIR